MARTGYALTASFFRNIDSPLNVGKALFDLLKRLQDLIAWGNSPPKIIALN